LEGAGEQEEEEEEEEEEVAPARRRVRLRNVPVQPEEQLRAALLAELARLWKVALSQPPPRVERLEVAEVKGERTYAQMLAGTEVTLQFAFWRDASWLVDGRNAGSWSRVLDLSLGSRILRAEWAEQVTDWGRLRHQAETDASSHISYNTVGTRQSYSAAFNTKMAAPRGGGGGEGAVSRVAPLNRTVVLEGLPRGMPEHQVRDEVVGLLKSLWRRDGLTFDPKEHLHNGNKGGGILVRRARRPGDENDGTCLVKLRRHIDAKWLAEGDAIRLSIAGGTPLRACWARPRAG